MKKTNTDLIKIYDAVHAADKKFFTVPPIEESIEIFKEIKDWNNLRVLEIGCGLGDLAAMVAKAGASKVVACDYSKSSIQKAKETYVLHNLEYICDDFNNLHFSEKFDIIILQGVLEHFDRPWKSLKYIIENFLNDSGTVINSCPAFYNPRGYIWMTLQLLFDVPMSLTDLHFLDIHDFKKFTSQNNLNLSWRSIHNSWGCGVGLVNDYKKRLNNALRDANLSNKNVDKLLDWVLESSPYFVKNNDSGACVIYKIKKLK